MASQGQTLTARLGIVGNSHSSFLYWREVHHIELEAEWDQHQVELEGQILLIPSTIPMQEES